MPLVKAATLSQLPVDSALERSIGGRVIAVCNAGGNITALDGLCPHHGGPLGYGHVVEGRVVCPWHLWEFDCRTGEFDRNPDCRLKTYRVEILGEEILIDIPEPGA